MNMSTIMQEYQNQKKRETVMEIALARREALRRQKKAEREFSRDCRRVEYPRYFKPSNHETRACIESRMARLTKATDTLIFIMYGGEKWCLGSFEDLMKKSGRSYKGTWQCIRLVKMLCLQGNVTPDKIVEGAYKVHA